MGCVNAKLLFCNGLLYTVIDGVVAGWCGWGVFLLLMKSKSKKSEVEFYDKDKGVTFAEINAGSEALDDRKRERLCQGIASGADSLELYWVLWKDEEGLPRSKKTTATSAKAKILKEPKVVARLKFLRGENAAFAKLGREEKLKITEEVIAGLRADFRAGVRGKTVNDLLSALQRHDQMTGEQEKPTLKIELGLGSLLENVDRLVEERQKRVLEGMKTETDKRIEAAKPADGEVVNV